MSNSDSADFLIIQNSKLIPNLQNSLIARMVCVGRKNARACTLCLLGCSSAHALPRLKIFVVIL